MFKVGIAYAVTTWILLQLTDVVSEILALPEWAPKLILLILVVGLAPAPAAADDVVDTGGDTPAEVAPVIQSLIKKPLF